VKHIASVHQTLWPDETGNKPLLSIGILTGKIPLVRDPISEFDNNGPGCKPKDLP
jgi:hypothetical protein